MIKVDSITYVLIIIIISACSSNVSKCNISDLDSYKSSEYTKRAAEIYAKGHDSMQLAIGYIDSAIVLNPSESNYALKWQYCMRAQDRAGALDAINSYWLFNSEGYSMAIATGLMYDIDNRRDSAEIFFFKAREGLSKIRNNHDDIYYKLDQKYIDILINGETDCTEYLHLLTAREDSAYLDYMINYLDTLTINTIKVNITN